MGKKNIRTYESHDFYCLNCGNKNIPIYRQLGHQHASGHRKILYCPFCKHEINHVECRTYEEVLNFKVSYEKGEFDHEAEESFRHVRSGRIG